MSTTSKITTPTANLEELAHYSNVSRFWWDDDGIMEGLKSMNQIRVPWIVNTLIELGIAKDEFVNTDKPLQGLTVLDAGCGGKFIKLLILLIMFSVYIVNVRWLRYRSFSKIWLQRGRT